MKAIGKRCIHEDEETAGGIFIGGNGDDHGAGYGIRG